MTIQTLVMQALNIAAIISILFCIFLLFTEKRLTICIVFRWMGFSRKAVKIYFCLVSTILLIRLASYVADFKNALTHNASVVFHLAIAYGFLSLSYKIYRRRVGKNIQ